MEALTTTTRRPWQDFPPELLGLVLQRVFSHTDCVRLRAVCRPWHAAARLQTQLPPLKPWLVLQDGTCFSLPNGAAAVHRIPVPNDVARCVSAGGSMLYLVQFNGRCSLMNPFSLQTTPQYINPELLWCRTTMPAILCANRLRKAVLMPDHNAIAVRTVLSNDVAISTRCSRRIGQFIDMMWNPPKGTVRDIAPFQGKLYAVTTTSMDGWRSRDLFVFHVVGGQDQFGVHCIINTSEKGTEPYYYNTYYYLVASGDRLLMVEQRRNKTLNGLAPRFEIFEAAELSSSHGRWRKTDTLMGRALFLSEGCSESLPAANDIGSEEDCIYFHSICHLNTRNLFSGVYNMRHKSLAMFHHGIMGDHDGPWSPTWIFPAGT